MPQQRAPVDRTVEISWNRHLVPFIEAQTDHDLAVALGSTPIAAAISAACSRPGCPDGHRYLPAI